MAFTIGTGKSFAATIVAGAITPTGWQQIVITETGKPVAAQIDTTAAAAGSYTSIDDPLGGQGSVSSSVTLEGLLSITDKADTGMLSVAIDLEVALVVRLGADTPGIWEYNITLARLSSKEHGGAFAGAQPFKYTWQSDSSAGAWGDSSG